AGLDLFDVVLEAAQRIEVAGPVHDVVAQQTDLRIAAHHAVEHHAARNVADTRNGVHLAHFDQADDLFFFLGREHARHGRLHFIHGVVDDVVVAQVDAVGFGQLLGALLGTDVKADDYRIGGDGQVDVAFGNAAHGRMHHLHAHFVGGQFGKR